MLESYQKKKKSPMKLLKSLKAGMLASGFENLSIMNLLLLFPINYTLYYIGFVGYNKKRNYCF